MVNRRRGRVTRTRGAVMIPLIALAIVVAVGLGSYRAGLLNDAICDGPCPAAYVEPPEQIDDPVAVAAARPLGSDAGPAVASKVTAAVRSALTQTDLGGHVGFIALDVETGDSLAAAGTGAFIPASTTKVLTAFAALASMDADERFATRVVGSSPSDLVLVGGGDPFLGIEKPKPALYAHSATLTALAKRTATALKAAKTTSVTLGFDDSLFTGSDASPSWASSYITGNITTPVSALWADQGVLAGIRSREPAQQAAATFASLLEKRGISVDLGARQKAAPDAKQIAAVQSATVSQILEFLVQQSDNQAAEVMLRHVAIAQGKPGTFTDGAAEVKKLLVAADVDVTGLKLYDGSGLSRANRISPLTLAETIRNAARDPRTASLVTDLPTGGFNGSTLNRFDGSTARSGRGSVRAKTGTLTGVHSLAGLARDADGHSIVFAAMTDDTKSIAPAATQAALDNLAASLAACSCGS